MKITKTASGKWTTTIKLTAADGTRHTKRFTGKTKDEVRQAANDYLTDHRVYAESLAFEDAMQRYIDAAERSLSPSTIKGYKSVQKVLKSDYAAFCGLSCDRIGSRDVQSVIDTLRSNDKSAKTVRNYIGLISAVITAEGFRMPSYNAPQAPVPRFNIPDEEIITKVSQACVGRYARLRIPLALACFGLRRGEICGVTADALEGDVLYVKSVRVVDYDGIEHVKDMPKNEQSIRAVQLPPAIAEEIRCQGCAWCGSMEALSHAWPHLCRKAGVEPFRLHDCRHFFVSYCHDVLHLSDSEIMRLGGWKTDSVMKRRYRHAITDHASQIVESLGSIVS